MKQYILIDGNNYMQIAIFAAKRQAAEDQVLYSMVKILRSMLNKLQQTFGYFSSYVVVWDSKGGSDWRKALDAGYKAGRVQHDDLANLTDAAKDVFAGQFIHEVAIEQSEADDLLYVVAELLRKTTPCQITIVSRDKDLIQIVQDGYADQIWDCVSKKFLEIPSYSIVDYKALVGDKSDGLRGLEGIGDKRAKKMLAEGFDRALIAHTRPLVHIPSNPRYTEYKERLGEWVNWFLSQTN
jgi:DNA polymerase-1